MDDHTHFFVTRFVLAVKCGVALGGASSTKFLFVAVSCVWPHGGGHEVVGNASTRSPAEAARVRRHDQRSAES